MQDGEDPFVNLIEHANDNFNAATVPGAFPVDFFPVLKKLPEWFPGAGFLKTAREWAKDTAKMVEVPYNYTKEQMVRLGFSSGLNARTQRHAPRLLDLPSPHSSRPVWRMRVPCPQMTSEI